MENNIIKGPETIFYLKTNNIGQAILNSFNDEPDHVAQIEADTGKQTTFNEMRENSIRCALWMQKQEIGVNDVVAICTYNHLNAYIPFIGALLNGAIYNPWHHEVTLKSAQHLMNLTKPKVIFTCELAVHVLQEAARLENIAPKIIVFENHPSLQSLKEVMDMQTNENVETFEMPIIEDEEAIAIILFSSGTSGMPKGVVHSYKLLLQNIMNFPFPPSHKSVCLWYSSLYWVSGSWNFLISILAGATVLFHENFDPIETCRIIERYKVNWFLITPTMITRWAKSDVLKDFELKSLNTLFTGGSKSNQEFLEELKNNIPNAPIIQVYGMTELGIPPLVQTDKCKMIDSVGFVSPNIQLKVIDINTGEVLGPNKAGELCVKSASMAVGYYKDPSATKSAIDEEGWIHTGDKVYYNEEGEFRIIDRIKNVMKFRGHQISPCEIEEILIRHPDVMEAAVVSVPHEIDVEQPMAFIKKIPGSKVTEDELIKLSSTLGEYKKLWGGVNFLEEIPLTASGKINRNKLREMALMYCR